LFYLVYPKRFDELFNFQKFITGTSTRNKYDVRTYGRVGACNEVILFFKCNYSFYKLITGKPIRNKSIKEAQEGRLRFCNIG